MTEAQPADVFTNLAHAVEQDDVTALAGLLAQDCTWTSVQGVRVTSESIAETLRRDSELRRRWFDELRREVRVEPLGPRRATLFVTEYLMKVPALWHRRHLRLDVETDRGDTITRVVERTAPEEAEAYARFLAACGIARDTD